MSFVLWLIGNVVYHFHISLPNFSCCFSAAYEIFATFLSLHSLFFWNSFPRILLVETEGEVWGDGSGSPERLAVFKCPMRGIWSYLLWTLGWHLTVGGIPLWPLALSLGHQFQGIRKYHAQDFVIKILGFILLPWILFLIWRNCPKKVEVSCPQS